MTLSTYSFRIISTFSCVSIFSRWCLPFLKAEMAQRLSQRTPVTGIFSGYTGWLVDRHFESRENAYRHRPICSALQCEMPFRHLLVLLFPSFGTATAHQSNLATKLALAHCVVEAPTSLFKSNSGVVQNSELRDCFVGSNHRFMRCASPSDSAFQPISSELPMFCCSLNRSQYFFDSSSWVGFFTTEN